MRPLTLKEKRQVYTRVACDLMMLAEQGLTSHADIEMADRIQELRPGSNWVSIMKNRTELMEEYMLFRPEPTAKLNLGWWKPEEYEEKIMAVLFCVEICR